MTKITATKTIRLGRVRDAADQPYLIETTAGSVAVSPDPAIAGVWYCIEANLLDSIPLDESTADYEVTMMAPTPAQAAVDYLTARAALTANA